jgi:N-acetylmuramoyl-L-alanine amidase-like protein
MTRDFYRRGRLGLITALLGAGLLLGLWPGAPPAQAAYPDEIHDTVVAGANAATGVLAAPVAARPFHVGLQAGHWLISQVPDSLARLRGDTGAVYGNYVEWKLNLDIAQRTAALLRAQGVIADVLPATVPTGYVADAFVAIHADGNTSTRARGYKVATRARSTVAWRDQLLMEALGSTYANTTGLPRDPSVTRGMTGYYAFNSYFGTDNRVNKTTPSAIIEMGFISNAADRTVMYGQPTTVATGIANGIMAYLHNLHAADAIQHQAETVAAASPSHRSVIVTDDGVRVHSAADSQSSVLATANRGDIYTTSQQFRRPPANFNPGPRSIQLVSGGWVKISLPNYDGDAYIYSDYVIIQQPTDFP